MQSETRTKLPNDKRLERARQHVSDLWFPVNTKLLERIRVNLSKNHYDSDIVSLVHEIKSDFSLFTFCLKKLAQILASEGVSAPRVANPIELLEWGGLQRLKKILTTENKDISGHSLSKMSDLQMSRYAEAMTSAATAEALSEKVGLDPETGFSAALLRQLGYTLIAWNYPTIYQRAVASMKSGMKLDVAIAQLLGFSPSLLAVSVVQEWGLAPEIYAAFDDYAVQSDDDLEREAQVRAVGDTLAKICKVGEALARANNPTIYPTARSDWQTARTEIEKRLGANGLDAIRDKVKDHCEVFIEQVPHVFRAGFALEPEIRIAQQLKHEVGSRNPYIERCPGETRNALEELYQRLDPSEILRENVSFLMREIIPGAGFNGGCVFTIDPTSMRLVPQTLIGRVMGRAVQAVPYSQFEQTSDAIAEAYRTKGQVLEFRETTDGAKLCICGVLGFSQRIGVLYLEAPKARFADAEEELQTIFKAFTQAINDCLNLR